MLEGDANSSESGRKTPSAFRYSMNSVSNGITIAFGVMRLNFGNQEVNAHASTARRVSLGIQAVSDGSYTGLRSDMSACTKELVLPARDLNSSLGQSR